MSLFLGIDTSNYTTSASIYDDESGRMLMQKKLLPVRQGECGLRQSDAVFHHVQQLPEIIDRLFDGADGEITAVGVSSRPRDAEGSYMPCFTVGLSSARIISKINGIPQPPRRLPRRFIHRRHEAISTTETERSLRGIGRYSALSLMPAI